MKENEKIYEFRWEAIVSKSVGIIANNEEEAYQKWINGDYGCVDIDDEDISGKTVEIDGEEFYNNKYKRV